MISLSLAQCAKTNLSNVPITDGQIVFCTDTGEFYRDVGSTRIPMALIVDSVSSLPLAPITNKFYFVSPYLYMFNGEDWIQINEPSLIFATSKEDFGTGDTNKLYIDTTNNKTYRFDGTSYVAMTGDTYSVATQTTDGLMSASDKVNLDKTEGHTIKSDVPENAVFTDTVYDDTSIKASIKANTDALGGHTVKSNVPADARFTDTTYSVASTSTSGLMSSDDKTKLNGIEAGAQVNAVISVNDKTGAVTLTKDDLGLGSVDNTTDSEKSVKYATTAGNVNGTVAISHGGTGATTASTALSNLGAMASNLKGAANGVAELDANGKVPSSQLPSYVDDVLEFAGKANFPASGETGKIYTDTDTNLTYR